MSERNLQATFNVAVWGFVALVLAAPWMLAGGTQVPTLWWASRAFGFVSYVALWLSMFTGVLLSTQRLPKQLDRKVLFELHQQWTLAAVIATALHVLAVVTHPEAGVGLAGALVPYASNELTGPVALGVLALWGLGLVAVSSWLRSRISSTTWRLIHTVAFGAFLVALAHSVTAGSDSAALAVQWLYALTGSTLAGAIVLRVASALMGRSRAAVRRPGHAR
ncbi:MAG TPA: ferric reductase-like transmembrane domain-containing protein [Dehalococcoidia bacterium]|nr:ferric reductase-like transmembrane domain-containing protein [Dehalococcoidia bacterium]